MVVGRLLHDLLLLYVSSGVSSSVSSLELESAFSLVIESFSRLFSFFVFHQLFMLLSVSLDWFTPF